MQILASHLYLTCQALDLRIIDLTFRAGLAGSLAGLSRAHLGAFVAPADQHALNKLVEDSIRTRMEHTAAMDAAARMADVFWFASAAVMEFLGVAYPAKSATANGHSFSNGHGNGTNGAALANLASLPSALAAWREAGTAQALELLKTARDALPDGGAAQHLGRGTRVLYQWVRKDLGIELRKGDVYSGGHQSPSIGKSVGVVYDALREGAGEKVIMKALALM